MLCQSEIRLFFFFFPNVCELNGVAFVVYFFVLKTFVHTSNFILFFVVFALVVATVISVVVVVAVFILSHIRTLTSMQFFIPFVWLVA